VSISLPSTLTVIGICAFADCVALAEIEIPDHVQWIGGSAFGGVFQSEKGKASGSAEKNRIWAVSGLQQFEERVYS